eukprot:TRINITY_DN7314_c0_g1_i4.p1 TRINITY_DN7314_c0_g1~~TRINITY_DN7314_c0_g1_i4.p1  ORF type:complete len:447 (-),score=77.38 TRINITY_DN7314_c0_g1_i4:16-1311(-)
MSENRALFCTSCSMYFRSADEHKRHFQSDFHKYNCKRKIVNLGPISLEEFDEKKAQVLNSSSSDISESANYRCETCNKAFSSNSQYMQHLRSKKHGAAEKAAKHRQEIGIQEMIESHGKVPSTLDSLGVCLFCNKKSKNLDHNFEHMEEVHSFVLPYSEQIKDKKAVMRYLAEKIHIGNICIGCNNYRTGGFKTSQAVQQHMMDKGHTFLDLSTFLEEYANFVKHKDKFMLKAGPMSSRISAVMSMKEVEEMKNKGDFEDLKLSESERKSRDTSEQFSQISAEDSHSVLSFHSSSSMASEVKEEKKIEAEEEDDWEDIELNEVKEASDQPELAKDSSLSMSEISSVSEASEVDEHILLSTGELLLSNGKLIGHRKYNYIYQQRRPLHDDRAVSYTHLRAHETSLHLVCRLLLEKKKKNLNYNHTFIQDITR